MAHPCAVFLKGWALFPARSVSMGAECEARFGLGEVEMKLDPGVCRGQLKELAAETHTRGYELYSRQATEAMKTGKAPAAPDEPVH